MWAIDSGPRFNVSFERRFVFQWQNADIDRALGSMRDQLVKRVAQNLHLDMPWFHGKISRQDAEERLIRDGHQEGKFL